MKFVFNSYLFLISAVSTSEFPTGGDSGKAEMNENRMQQLNLGVDSSIEQIQAGEGRLPQDYAFDYRPVIRNSRRQKIQIQFNLVGEFRSRPIYYYTFDKSICFFAYKIFIFLPRGKTFN